MTGLCSWLCVPDGPSTPFAGPLLAVADSARVGCVLAGLIVLLYTGSSLARCAERGQRARFVALALFAVLADSISLEHWGDLPSYRTVIDVLACGLAMYGVLHFRREVPQRGRG